MDWLPNCQINANTILLQACTSLGIAGCIPWMPFDVAADAGHDLGVWLLALYNTVNRFPHILTCGVACAQIYLYLTQNCHWQAALLN